MVNGFVWSSELIWIRCASAVCEHSRANGQRGMVNYATGCTGPDVCLVWIDGNKQQIYMLSTNFNANDKRRQFEIVSRRHYNGTSQILSARMMEARDYYS